MKIHVMGIGGAGCNALAGWLHAKGNEVTGCDLVINKRSKHLIKEGVQIKEGHSPNHLKNIEWLIHTPAAKPDEAEISKAKEVGIKVSSYVEALGEISKDYTTIAIAGAHGKTTTTKMIGEICEEADLDPNYIVGEGIYRAGEGNIFILEACEYRGHFLNYQPDLLVITNIEHDHPDSYKDINEVRAAFLKLVDNVRKGGTVIGFADDPDVEVVLKHTEENGLRVKRYSADDILEFNTAGWGSKSTIRTNGKEIRLELAVPGKHNVLNALSAIFAASALGVDARVAVKSLKRYKTVMRRMEKFGEIDGVPLITDWAHHPGQIDAVVKTMRATYPNGKFAIFFEPHQYQRTLNLFDELKTCWGTTDYLFILPIYKVAGRETKEALKSVSSERLAKAITQGSSASAISLRDYEEMDRKIDEIKGTVDAIAFLNAGKLDDYIRNKYGKRHN